MADSEHSSSDETSVYSRGTILLTLTFVVSPSLPTQLVGKNINEETSQESKLEFSEDEEALIIRMFNLVGERWSLIAGRIPGRTAEEIEKYWNTRYSTSE
ncbi:PREDICTED: MYB-like transcription factor ETC1 isoform X1 [Populus euphratica]|uniref:MYB-like transcription factor ETC1 isoform X1 n=1 Tax=Populus euphratica TaxID=75702 RepID=A0AAJ6TBW5_POPEU|nr:PREDICTED: MYB-like transcription factor ETC1 isoform X1 [Populus euphratica]